MTTQGLSQGLDSYREGHVVEMLESNFAVLPFDTVFQQYAQTVRDFSVSCTFSTFQQQ